jgi:hypothetical protein
MDRTTKQDAEYAEYIVYAKRIFDDGAVAFWHSKSFFVA